MAAGGRRQAAASRKRWRGAACALSLHHKPLHRIHSSVGTGWPPDRTYGAVHCLHPQVLLGVGESGQLRQLPAPLPHHPAACTRPLALPLAVPDHVPAGCWSSGALPVCTQLASLDECVFRAAPRHWMTELLECAGSQVGHWHGRGIQAAMHASERLIDLGTTPLLFVAVCGTPYTRRSRHSAGK